VLAIAHRAPASAAACATYVGFGVRVFEIDVQAIDGELVVSHFLPVPGVPKLRRDRWSVTAARRTAAEIALAAAVASVPPEAEVLLDLKTDRGEAALDLARLVLASDLDPRRCHASSKGWASLELLRAKGWRTWRSVADAAALAAAIREGPVQSYAYTLRHTLLTRQTVPALHKLAPRVMAWTVNDVKRARTLAELGVDGITSDSPRVLELAARLEPGKPE
jgi:glycerophosphoryl diester phosphodiesterase